MTRKLFRTYSWVAPLAVLTACVTLTPSPPATPAKQTLRVQLVDDRTPEIPLHVVGHVAMDEAGGPIERDTDGNASVEYNLVPGPRGLLACAPGYTCRRFDAVDNSLLEGGSKVRLFVAALRLAAPAGAGETGLIHRDGLRFAKEDGSTFRWRGCTDFLLFKLYLDSGEAALLPVVQQRIAGGCNTFRVLGMVDSFAKLRPSNDHYYVALYDFINWMNALGVRVEFVAFADAQVIMADPGEQERHIEKVYAALAEPRPIGGQTTNFLEAVNEPFKNIPGGGARAYALGQLVQGRSPRVLVASGDYDISPCTTTFPHLDYLTLHTERKPDWPRTARALAEVRDGFGWGPTCAEFVGVRVPVVGDEPMGFGEAETGSRSVSVDDAAYFAATCGLMGAGCTFHSSDGITSTLWGPMQQATATAFFDALKWVPDDAQLAPYMRGGTEPGCHWIGDSVAEHDDARELRSFAKIVNGDAWLVQIRTNRPQVTPCGSWRVESSPRPGLAHLVR